MSGLRSRSRSGLRRQQQDQEQRRNNNLLDHYIDEVDGVRVLVINRSDLIKYICHELSLYYRDDYINEMVNRKIDEEYGDYNQYVNYQMSVSNLDRTFEEVKRSILKILYSENVAMILYDDRFFNEILYNKLYQIFEQLGIRIYDVDDFLARF